MPVAFMFLFGVDRGGTHMVRGMGPAGFIAFTVPLVHRPDSPFGGMLSASADSFTRYFALGRP